MIILNKQPISRLKYILQPVSIPRLDSNIASHRAVTEYYRIPLEFVISPIPPPSPTFKKYIVDILCTIPAIVGCDDIFPAEKPSAERALPLENGGISTTEKTSIIHVIEPI
jgi:hypothetical protein